MTQHTLFNLFKILKPTLILCLTLLPVHTSKANSTHHSHGLSELTIAMDKNKLEIQVISPAMDLVGFEYKAKTQAQQNKIRQVQKQLNNHALLFILDKGNCSHTNTTIDVVHLLQSDHQKHNHESNNGEHSHNEHHSEITANYQYDCANPSNISSLKTNIFNVFTGIQKIKVIWITPKKQDSGTLTPNKATIQFK